jgi:hypothetical protein
MRECDGAGTIPAVAYYQVHGEPGGGEAQFLAKLQDAGTMASYFTDVKLLMQRAKDFAKPVIVLVEADGTGLLQQQTASNPNAYAAIRDSGMAELQSLPNTVAGFGLAFLQLRKSVGRTTFVLGMHVSAWASGKDIAHFNVTDALGPEVAKVYNFLAPSGRRATSRARRTTCSSVIRSTATRISTGSRRTRIAGGMRATRLRLDRRASIAMPSG